MLYTRIHVVSPLHSRHRYSFCCCCCGPYSTTRGLWGRESPLKAGITLGSLWGVGTDLVQLGERRQLGQRAEAHADHAEELQLLVLVRQALHLAVGRPAAVHIQLQHLGHKHAYTHLALTTHMRGSDGSRQMKGCWFNPLELHLDNVLRRLCARRLNASWVCAVNRVLPVKHLSDSVKRHVTAVWGLMYIHIYTHWNNKILYVMCIIFLKQYLFLI